MSQFNWPHPAYAEDQPYAKSLLYVHVFHRGYEAGAIFGVLHGLYKIRKASGKNKAISSVSAAGSAATSAATSTSIPKSPFSSRQIFFNSVGKGSLIGGAATMALLTARMWGLQEIEWQDRTWRLLENKGQVMHDKYCDWGVGVGALSMLVASASRGVVVKRLVSWEMAGRTGVGALVGMVACEVVRKGWGEEEEDKKKKKKDK